MEDKKSKCNSNSKCKSNSQYGGPSLRSRMTAKNKQRQQQQQIPFLRLRSGRMEDKKSKCNSKCSLWFVFMLWFYFSEMGIVTTPFLFGLECWG